MWQSRSHLSFTREEVRAFLHWAMYALADTGFSELAGQYEDAYHRIARLTPVQCHAYADFVLPPGRPGHIMLVLEPPHIARGIALLAWLLRSVDALLVTMGTWAYGEKMAPRPTDLVDTRARKTITLSVAGQDVPVGLHALTSEQIRASLVTANDLVPSLKPLLAKWKWTAKLSEKDATKVTLRLAEMISILALGCVDVESPEDAPVPFFDNPTQLLDLPLADIQSLYKALGEWQEACTYPLLPESALIPFNELNLALDLSHPVTEGYTAR
jgi:hypothetical protein